MVSITALRSDYGDIIGYLLVGADNSMRKQVEMDLHSAMAVAEKANLAKSDFSVQHEPRELRNAAQGAILGFAQLMESRPRCRPLCRKSGATSNKSSKAGWYLLDLINEILDLAVIESGKLSLSLEPISLAEVLNECRAMIEPQAEKRGIGVSFPRFETPQFVKADRTRVKQVLINLLSNAIKYNNEGGTVVVDCAAGGPWDVSASACGIPARAWLRISSPSYSSRSTVSARRTVVEEGTGIGLVVCKRLIEMMGGAIGVESGVGAGSVFWIELNLTEERQLKAGEPTAPARIVVQADAQLRIPCSTSRTTRPI